MSNNDLDYSKTSPEDNNARPEFGVVKDSNFHFHRDVHGKLVECYHSTKSVLLSASFWLGVTLSYPLEHYLWEHVWPFNAVIAALASGH